MNILSNILSVLFSLLKNPLFLELSDIGILRALKENDTNAIPNGSYQCSIKFLIDELKEHYNKNQKQENQIQELWHRKEAFDPLPCRHKHKQHTTTILFEVTLFFLAWEFEVNMVLP